MSHPLIADLKTARGRRFYDILGRIMADIGEDVKADFRSMRTEDTITVGNLGVLCLRYELPFKTLCQWLEREQLMATGTYDVLQRNGLKVGKILEAVRGATE